MKLCQKCGFLISENIRVKHNCKAKEIVKMDIRNMDIKQAKEIIKNNYPSENYTMLREALDWLIEQAEKKTDRDFLIERNQVINEQQKEIDRLKGLFGEKQQWIQTITFSKNDKDS